MPSVAPRKTAKRATPPAPRGRGHPARGRCLQAATATILSRGGPRLVAGVPRDHPNPPLPCHPTPPRRLPAAPAGDLEGLLIDPLGCLQPLRGTEALEPAEKSQDIHTVAGEWARPLHALEYLVKAAAGLEHHNRGRWGLTPSGGLSLLNALIGVLLEANLVRASWHSKPNSVLAISTDNS